MAKVVFEELSKEERALLLRVFDYDVDAEGFILSPTGSRIPSDERPSTFLRVDDTMFTPGSLVISDGTPTSISKFIREKVEKGG